MKNTNGSKPEMLWQALLHEVTIVKMAFFISVIVIVGNLSAVIDAVHHPEIPYFHAEHLIVGGVYALLVCCLFIGLAVYNAKRKMIKEDVQHAHDVQKVISSLLSLSLDHVTLETILEKALCHLLSIEWLVFQGRGSIFLVDDDSGELVMKVSSGLDERIQKACSRISFGRCLCGLAASASEIQFADRIDERHVVSYEGMVPHGHYCVPILFGEKTLGVVSLYLKEGHERSEKEEEFLTAVANTLASIIMHKKSEEQILHYQGHLEALVKERTLSLQAEVAERKLSEEEVKKLNEELKKQIIELDEARILAESGLKAREEFLANISHELVTPLNSIIGFSQILLDSINGSVNSEQKEYAASILQGGKRLHETLKEIVQIAVLESGEMKLCTESFLINNLLRFSIMTFDKKAAAQGVALSLETDLLPETEIEADSEKLRQIIFNLLDNAVKFTPSGGNVFVRARKVNSEELPPLSPLLARVEMRGRELIEISVTDTGIGIKPGDMTRLFKPFQQLESVYTKKYKGTGLGLVLAKRLIELHGGRICVESEFGKGSTFTFAIPVRQAGLLSGKEEKQ